MKKHNFSAGPSILPKYTIEQTANAILDLDGTGLSLMEISHRSKEFISIMTEAQNLLKELLEVPEGYSVLYLGGGASLQFLMVPMNFLKNKAAYLNTGSWSSKAIKEAKSVGEVIEVASSKDKNFSYIPKNYTVPSDVDYFHITTNNTIFGTQLKSDPKVPVLMAADMSSDILSRPVDVSKYAIIYGGLQKNIGPAGCAFVIVKDDLLGLSGRKVPTYLDYKIHVENESMYNTPPVVPVYSALMTYRWLKELGGVNAIQKINEDKAALLYNEIDSNRLFKSTVEDASDRSSMNVCFVMADEYKDLEEEFMNFAKEKGMVGIKGHRSVGGFRASIYNAMPTESVKALIDCMKDFDRKK